MSRIRFSMELESVRQNLIEMGETAMTIFRGALQAISAPNPEALAQAKQLEAKTDEQHRLIHDQCLNLITLQAPVARDARFVTGVLDAITDLELIADYASEIVMLSSSMRRRPPSQILAQISDVGAKIQDVLAMAIDNWRVEERAQSLPARPQESGIKGESAALYEKLSQLTSAPGQATTYVDLMLIVRYLQRILRHASGVMDLAAGAVPAEQVLPATSS
jgi:phosphate transport system protein